MAAFNNSEESIYKRQNDEKHIGFLSVLLTYILTWSVEIPVA